MWFIETPWPPIALCVVFAVVLYSCWTYKQHYSYLKLAVGLIVLAVVIFFAEKTVTTEKEVVEESLIAMTTAFEDDDVEKTLSFISSNPKKWRITVGGIMLVYQIDGYLRITNIKVREESEGIMISHFRANGLLKGRGSEDDGWRFTTRWEFTWKKDPQSEKWLITKIQRLDPMSGAEIEITAQRAN